MTKPQSLRDIPDSQVIKLPRQPVPKKKKHHDPSPRMTRLVGQLPVGGAVRFQVSLLWISRITLAANLIP